MPEFKAPPRPAEPLRCTLHGNDPTCGGPYVCPHALLPSAPPAKKEASDESVNKAIAELYPAGLAVDDEMGAARVMERAKQIDALVEKS